MNSSASHAQAPRASFYTSHRAPLYFLALSFLCQVIGIGVLSIVKDSLVHPVLLLSLQSIIAFFIARWLSLPLPWQLFNLLLAPAVITYGYFELPSGIIFFALLLTLLMYAPTFWTRVPYFPTHPKVYDEILGLIPENKPLRFIDLGCGTGRLLHYLAKHRPEVRFVGVEISPLAYLIARVWTLFHRHTANQVTIQLKNFWNMSLEEFDIVYAFLAPGPMPGLWQKAQDEMKRGSMFITNTFPVQAEAAQRIELDDSHQHSLYVHKM